MYIFTQQLTSISFVLPSRESCSWLMMESFSLRDLFKLSSTSCLALCRFFSVFARCCSSTSFSLIRLSKLWKERNEHRDSLD